MESSLRRMALAEPGRLAVRVKYPTSSGVTDATPTETMIQPVTLRAVAWNRLARRSPIPHPTAAWVRATRLVTASICLGRVLDISFLAIQRIINSKGMPCRFYSFVLLKSKHNPYTVTTTSSLYVLILAGGSGERFWPLSRKNRPKQLLSLFSTTTLLEETL